MRRFLFLMILLLPLLSFGQGVAKERLFARSYYSNGIRHDSIKLDYKNPNVKNSYEALFFQFANQYRDINYSRRTSYHPDNKIRWYQAIKNEGRDNSINLGWFNMYDQQHRKEYVNYLSEDTNLVTSHFVEEPWGLTTATLFFKNHKLYDSESRLVQDSLSWRTSHNNFPFRTTVLKYKYYENNVRVKTKKEYEYAFPNKFVFEIDSSGNGYSHRNFYTLKNDTIKYHTVWFIKYDESSRTTLFVEQSLNNNSWDTIGYEENHYIDSNSNNTKIEWEYKKEALLASFLPTKRIIRKYSSLDTIREYEISTFHTSGNWKPTLKINYDYYNNGLLAKIASNDIAQNYMTTYDYTYTEQGNLESDITTIINDSSKSKSEYYYYYEPYLTKETDLIYTGLSPIVYPNPTSASTNILFSCVPNKKGTITISNVNGEIVDRHDFSTPSEIYQYHWNAIEQPAGLYFANITMGKEVATMKIIKQ